MLKLFLPGLSLAHRCLLEADEIPFEYQAFDDVFGVCFEQTYLKDVLKLLSARIKESLLTTSKNVHCLVLDFNSTELPEQESAVQESEDVQPSARDLFVDLCSKSATRAMLVKTEKNLTPEEQRKKVRELKKSLAQKVGGAQGRENHFLSGQALDREAFGREYDSLLRIPKVVDVRFESASIDIYTKVLFCVNPRTSIRHEIGAFIIKLFPGQTTAEAVIRWYNQTRRVTGMNASMHAPHIYEDGHACLGNTKELFPRLIQDREFAIAAQLAIEFVESVNVDDTAGKYVGNWPPAGMAADRPIVKKRRSLWEALTASVGW